MPQKFRRPFKRTAKTVKPPRAPRPVTPKSSRVTPGFFPPASDALVPLETASGNLHIRVSVIDCVSQPVPRPEGDPTNRAPNQLWLTLRSSQKTVCLDTPENRGRLGIPQLDATGTLSAPYPNTSSDDGEEDENA